jgi:hypothetical protein
MERGAGAVIDERLETTIAGVRVETATVLAEFETAVDAVVAASPLEGDVGHRGLCGRENVGSRMRRAGEKPRPVAVPADVDLKGSASLAPRRESAVAHANDGGTRSM